jgi:hypothetical protein
MSDSKLLRPPQASMPPELASKKVKPNNYGRTIDVFCRFRPIGTPDKRSPYYIIDPIDNFIELDAPDEIIQKNSKIKKYSFTKVFDETATQDEIFDDTVKKMVAEMFNARISGVIFSYGVTNAGKTHTIIGNKQDPGLLPRLLRYLMDAKDAVVKGDAEFEGIDSEHPVDLEVSFESFEIYNEEIYDLNPDPKKHDKVKSLERPKLKVKEGPQQSLIIEDLQKVLISTEEEAASIVNRCLKNRQVAATTLNSSSSRSHTIFRVTVDMVELISDQSRKIVKRIGHICVVDLAGSERAKRTDNVEGKLKEAGGINNSLMVLGRCFQALKNNSIVPYRDCKLTRLLSEFFKYESRIKMITNINPREEDFTESLRVLNYASLAKEVKFIASTFKSIRMESNMKMRAGMQNTNSRMGTSMGDLDSCYMGDMRNGQLYPRASVCKGNNFEAEYSNLVMKGASMWEDHENVDKFVQTMGKMMRGLMDEYKSHTEQIMRQLKNETIKAVLERPTILRDKKQTVSADNTPSKFTKTELHLEIVPNSTSVGQKTFHNKATSTAKSAPKLPSTAKKTRGQNSTMIRSLSEDEGNFKPRQPIRIRPSAIPADAPNKVQTPEVKKLPRSSFYDSLLKQPRMKDESIIEISRREHLKLEKEKYYFLLEICDNDFDEAEKWFRSEFEHSPPKLTSKEKQSCLHSAN